MEPALAQLEFTQMAMYASDCAPAKTIMVEHELRSTSISNYSDTARTGNCVVNSIAGESSKQTHGRIQIASS